jgi:hypothetical protein
MTWLDAPKSEHEVRREHYVAGRQDERERIIALLDNYTMYRFEKELVIALIKGEEA